MPAVKHLVVGDPHSTPDELDDCEALLRLVQRTADEHRVGVITFLGDLYNSHDVVTTRCIEFWHRWFRELSGQAGVVAIRGNHDQVTPSEAFPHALLAHPDIVVIDRPQAMPYLEGCVAMPYYHDAAEFLEGTRQLARMATRLLFCHQTFQGAQYENGFYAKDGVDVNAVGIPSIISGHIHSPQKVGKASYPGAPRWRTLSDANEDRFLWVLEHDGDHIRLAAKVPTGDACRRIWRYDDRPEAPADVSNARPGDDVRIDVYGPTPEYVAERRAALKASCGAVTRPFPERARKAAVSEALGVEVAFDRYRDQFRAPNGSAPEVLSATVRERLAEVVT